MKGNDIFKQQQYQAADQPVVSLAELLPGLELSVKCHHFPFPGKTKSLNVFL